MIDIFKHKGEIFEVIRLVKNKDWIAWEILVKLSSPKHELMEKKSSLAAFRLDYLDYDYKEDSIAIIDNVHYTIIGASLGGTDGTIEDKNSFVSYERITCYKLGNNFSSLSEEDRTAIKSLQGINKFNL